MEDDKIIRAIREGKEQKALRELYRYYPKVRDMVLAKGGQKEDAEDLFQEALVIFCRKVEEADFERNSALNSYLFGICRLLWRNQLRKRKEKGSEEVESGLSDEAEAELEETLEKEERLRAVERIVEELGEKCRSILQLFYYQALRMKEIAQRLGYSSEKSAKNQKYKCIESAKGKLRREHPA